MDYRPDPIDTESFELDPSLIELTEYLARNTHEVWASLRIAEGWTWGPVRDDAGKRHPNLVPYRRLTEVERDMDRQAAIQTLKLIRHLGYTIVPPAPKQPADGGGGAKGKAAIAGPPESGPLSLSSLVGYWQAWENEDPTGRPGVYQRLGAAALELSEFLLAFDILQVGLRGSPADVKLRQTQARALVGSGALESATSILRALRDEGHDDEETLGLLARARKDLWERSLTDPTVTPEESRDRLAKAYRSYEAAYGADSDRYWTGINAATLALCYGETARATELARAVAAACETLVDKTAGQDYWPLATLGEAALVRGDFAAAASYYRRAAALAKAARKFGQISSTRRNARLLLHHLHAQGTWPAGAAPPPAAAPPVDAPEPACAEAANPVRDLLDDWLPLPTVVVFCGHMIDRPGRRSPRFPADLEPAVAAEIRASLDSFAPGFGYASAACGSDILFLEAMVDRGAEVTIVLPYALEQFTRESVDVIPGGDWKQRLERLLANTAQVRVVAASQDRIQAVGVANEFSNQFTFGLAGIRAWHLGAELAPLTVWDKRPGDGPGGTADAVSRWRACRCEPTVIDLSALLRAKHPELAPAEVTPARAGGGRRAAADAPDTEAGPSSLWGLDSGSADDLTAGGDVEMGGRMAAMLFGDVEGYSKLTDDEIPLFVRHFLQAVSDLARRSPHKPVQKNTWGDGIYFVFESVTDAGQFALELQQLVANTDWMAKGFSRPLGLRTALHVGPVYACRNPVTGQRDHIGTQVSRAARLEPITPRGQVYASEVFAAIAFAEGADGFLCEYVGKMGLAKNYGTFPTYHVRRSVQVLQG